MFDRVRNIFLPDYLIKRLLHIRYGFEKWHVNPLRRRPYALELIQYLNDRFDGDRMTVIEIGCGLGDIIRNLRFTGRYGYDMDSKVIAAASWLSQFDKEPRTQFGVFSFPGTLDKSVDCILLVNWIHHIEPSLLKSGIARYFNENLKPGGELIVDTVSDPQYKYNHKIELLTDGLACTVFQIGSYERDRKVFAIRKPG